MSSDYGATWDEASSELDWSGVAVSSSGNNKIIVLSQLVLAVHLSYEYLILQASIW